MNESKIKQIRNECWVPVYTEERASAERARWIRPLSSYHPGLFWLLWNDAKGRKTPQKCPENVPKCINENPQIHAWQWPYASALILMALTLWTNGIAPRWTSISNLTMCNWHAASEEQDCLQVANCACSRWSWTDYEDATLRKINREAPSACYSCTWLGHMILLCSVIWSMRLCFVSGVIQGIWCMLLANPFEVYTVLSLTVAASCSQPFAACKRFNVC